MPSASSRKARLAREMRSHELPGCLRRSKPPPRVNEDRRTLWRPRPGQRRRRRLTAIVSVLRYSLWQEHWYALRRTSYCPGVRRTCPFPCYGGRLTSCSLLTNRDLKVYSPFPGG